MTSDSKTCTSACANCCTPTPTSTPAHDRVRRRHRLHQRQAGRRLEQDVREPRPRHRPQGAGDPHQHPRQSQSAHGDAIANGRGDTDEQHLAWTILNRLVIGENEEPLHLSLEAGLHVYLDPVRLWISDPLAREARRTRTVRGDGLADGLPFRQGWRCSRKALPYSPARTGLRRGAASASRILKGNSNGYELLPAFPQAGAHRRHA